MLRQEAIQYVYHHLKSGHSAKSIQEELKGEYSQEDIDDAFLAAGYNPNRKETPSHHNIPARWLMILVLAVLAGLILGLGSYGFGKLNEKLSLIETSNQRQPPGNSPEQFTPPPVPEPEVPAVSFEDAVGMEKCSLYSNQESQEAAGCRRTEALKMQDITKCRDFPDIRVYNTCSRAFYELFLEREQAQQ